MEASSQSFVIAHSNSCIGCKACEVACFAVHNRNNGVAATVGTVAVPVIPRLYVLRTERFTMPVQCRQCENAPCANACPVQAIRHEDNAIVIDADSCIGCKTCALACPFGAITLADAYSSGSEVRQSNLKERRDDGLMEAKRKTVAYKCDLCKENGKPACVEACPQNVLTLFTPAAEKQARNRRTALLPKLGRER